jgi:membrane peptidoglycan carboxypeptidase
LKHHYNLPKDKSAAQAALLMGKIKAPESLQPNANLEAALERLKEAIGKAEAQRTGRGS